MWNYVWIVCVWRLAEPRVGVADRNQSFPSSSSPPPPFPLSPSPSPPSSPYAFAIDAWKVVARVCGGEGGGEGGGGATPGNKAGNEVTA